MASGGAAIEKVLASMRERGGFDAVLQGYRGTLIANLRTAPDYYRAVDTVAGSRFVLRAGAAVMI